MAKVLIMYHSFTGKTKLLAQAVAEGARESKTEVVMKEIGGVTLADLQAANAVILGTPQPFGSLAGETKKFFETFWGDREKIGQKPWAVFITHVSDPQASLSFLERQGPRFGFVKGVEWLTVKREEAEQHLERARKLGSAIAAQINA